MQETLQQSYGMFEGTLVRQLRSLDELLRQLCLAAVVVGNSQLAKRFEACQVSIHRGVPFTNSLYLTDAGE